MGGEEGPNCDYLVFAGHKNGEVGVRESPPPIRGVCA